MGTDFCIKPGYVEREAPAYFLDDPKGITYQPDVYWYAYGAALELGASGIVDVGCGYAPKLEILHAHRPDWRYVGIDHGKNIGFCQGAFAGGSSDDWGEWLAIDLEQPHEYDATDAVVVCADVIEHLRDPRPLLTGIRGSGCRAAVLSTPERDLEWGVGHNGPPPNPCHVREWNRVEFGDFLAQEGFALEHLGLTRPNDQEPREKTILARAVSR